MEYLGLGGKEVQKNDGDMSEVDLNGFPMAKCGTL